MNRISDYLKLTCDITHFLCNYCAKNGIESLVVGVSGGIDSAVSSTLAAKTGLPVYAIGMPLNQSPEQETLSDAHLFWLEKTYKNVTVLKTDLTKPFNKLMKQLTADLGLEYTINEMARANSKSRMRMVTLYQVAASVGGIVVGTGNKVEDYGVGFYTKYGDGGVDIAPIADLYKTEVRELGRFLGVIPEIIEAKPTDGLWEDGRNDEDQLGASYEMLEWVMESGISGWHREPIDQLTQWMGKELTEEQKEAIRQYAKFNTQNKHKMNPIPTFKLEV